MTSFSNIDQQLERLMHSDFIIQFDKTTYAPRLSPHQCMLLHFISLGNACIAKQMYSPSVLMLDYNARIICNRHFTIELPKQSSKEQPTNLRLDLITDTAQQHSYYLFQDKAQPEAIVFQVLNYSVAFTDFSFSDYSRVVQHVVTHLQLQDKYPTLNFEMKLHHIDFSTGRWQIFKP